MINRLKYATIADIGIYDLVFYDELKLENNIAFAKDNGISYLPEKNRKEVYKLVGETFVKMPLEDSFKINPYDRVFDQDTLNKFELVNHNEIRFIMENDLIKGVVHIVDYNNEFLQVQLYRALFLFESNLRKHLFKSGKQNIDFLKWVKKQSQVAEDKTFWKSRYNVLMPSNIEKRNQKEKVREELNPFQTFLLSELMHYASDVNLIKLNKTEIHNIGTIRNQIAHSVDFTSSNIDNAGNLLFNFEGLSKYVRNIGSFFNVYDELLEEVQK